MAQIGTFVRTKQGFSGRLRTLSLDIELTLVPEEHSVTENAPNYSDSCRRRRRPGSRRWVGAHRREGRRVDCLADRRPHFQPAASGQSISVRQRSLHVSFALDASGKARQPDLIRAAARQINGGNAAHRTIVRPPFLCSRRRRIRPPVPLAVHAAFARSGGQGRPQAGARALPLTAASTRSSPYRSAGGDLWPERM